MTTQSCQTCLSDLRAPPAFIPPCCGVPICESCVAANPRLKTWVPCLRCGSSSSTSTAKGKKVEEGGRVEGVKTTQVDGGKRDKKRERREAEADQFVLVDSDEEGDDDEGGEGEGEGEGGDGRRKGEGGGDGGDGEGRSAEEVRGEGKEDVAGERAPSPEIVEIKHVPQRGETLLTIARKYATDVSPPPLPTF